MQFPIFSEVASSRDRDRRIFDVVFPGFVVSGTFKWIRIKNGTLDMRPADGDQVQFKPTEKDVVSRIFLLESGEIAPALLKKT